MVTAVMMMKMMLLVTMVIMMMRGMRRMSVMMVRMVTTKMMRILALGMDDNVACSRGPSPAIWIIGYTAVEG